MGTTNVGWMKRVVESLGKHPGLRKPFFWSTFYTVRLMYPLQYLILRELLGVESVLDLGCGRHSMVPILPSGVHTVGVELFKPHLDEAIRSGRHKAYVHGDVTRVDFPERSFDAVVMLDVLEHLDREAGDAMLRKMERWARKKVVIFTPNGFLHQHEYDDNPLMEHRSGWTAEELKARGFKVYGIRGLKSLKKDHGHDHEDEASKWRALDGLSDLTQIYTYYAPEHAFQLFAVKEVARGGVR